MGINRNIGILYLDRQAGNVVDFYRVLNEMEFIYQVSKSAIRLRLRELNILEDKANLGNFKPSGPVGISNPLADFLGDLREKISDDDDA